MAFNVDKEREKRRCWTDEETIAFLQCYKKREFEMSQPRRKMIGFNAILDDLTSIGVLQSPATPQNLLSKFSSLTRAYQCAVYTEAARGKGASEFRFMALMENILASAISSTDSSSSSSFHARPPSTDVSAIASSSANIYGITKNVQPNTSSSSNAWTTELKRGNWTHQETLALINCYASREEEYQHPKKYKTFFKNILEDLMSNNVLSGPTTELNVKAKWNSLFNAYKSASDNVKRTGRSVSTFMYMDAMDEIFGNRPIMANAHTVNLHGEPIEALPTFNINAAMNDMSDEVDSVEVVVPDEIEVKIIDETVDEINFEGLRYSAESSNAGRGIEIIETPAVPFGRNFVSKQVFRNVPNENSVERIEKEVYVEDICDSVESNTAAVPDKRITMPVENISCSSRMNRSILSANEKMANPFPPNVLKTAASKRARFSDPFDSTALMSREEIEEESLEFQQKNCSNATSSVNPNRLGKCNYNQKATNKPGLKDRKLPFSFRRTKTAKEIVQEKKEEMEKMKIKAKAEARMAEIRFVEEGKQKRHKERCEVMNKLLEKM